MIDIVTLDPHPVTRAGLRRLATEHAHLRIIGEATTVSEAISLVNGPTRPGVLILDLSQSGEHGFDSVACIHAHAPALNILVFTAHAAKHHAIEALRQGARGYLNKDCETEAILEAIQTVFQGRRHFSMDVAELLAAQMDHATDGGPHERLSRRESEVFFKLAKGESPARIADALTLSVKTVSTYRARLLQKMSLRSNSDLTYYALNNQLIA